METSDCGQYTRHEVGCEHWFDDTEVRCGEAVIAKWHGGGRFVSVCREHDDELRKQHDMEEPYDADGHGLDPATCGAGEGES